MDFVSANGNKHYENVNGLKNCHHFNRFTANSQENYACAVSMSAMIFS